MNNKMDNKKFGFQLILIGIIFALLSFIMSPCDKLLPFCYCYWSLECFGRGCTMREICINLICVVGLVCSVILVLAGIVIYCEHWIKFRIFKKHSKD